MDPSEYRPKGNANCSSRLSILLWGGVLAFAIAAGIVVFMALRQASVARLTADVTLWKQRVVSREKGLVVDIQVSCDATQVDVFVRDGKWWKLSQDARKQFLTTVRHEFVSVCAQRGIASNHLIIWVESADESSDGRWYAFAESHPDVSSAMYAWNSTNVMEWKTEK